jgi:hypothetical protein
MSIAISRVIGEIVAEKISNEVARVASNHLASNHGRPNGIIGAGKLIP